MKLGYLNIVDSNVYVSSSLLIDNGLNRRTLLNYISKYNQNKSFKYANFKDDNGLRWILYDSIPINIIKKLGLPLNSKKLQSILKNAVPENHKKSINSNSLDFYFTQTFNNNNYWNEYIPIYKEYFSDIEVIHNYSRTHAVVELMLNLRKNKKVFPLTDIFKAFQKLPKVTFKIKNFDYFCRKLKKFSNGIPEELVHDFKINGREPYKVNEITRSLIKFYYSNSKVYTLSQIYSIVNHNLENRGLQKISRTTVSNICNIELKNKADILRYGRKYAEDKILPYLTRDSVKQICDLYEIDCTKVNFPFLQDGNIKYLVLCAIIDVCSRKIVGYKFAESENFELINSTIKMALEKHSLLPKNILIDNHKAYYSNNFNKLKLKLQEYGVVFRYAKVGNAKDKAHIESWFSKFQIQYLNGVYGFLGEGIKSKRLNVRKNEEMISEFMKKKNLVNKEELIKLISKKIEVYNDSFNNSINSIPAKVFNREKNNEHNNFNKINKYDLVYIFGEKKKLKIINSKLEIKSLGSKYSYTIWNTQNANKVNRTTVFVHYDQFDMENVHIYDLNNRYLFSVVKDPMVSVIPYSEDDMKIYQSHSIRKDAKIKQNLKELYIEIKTGLEDLTAIPIVNLDKNLVQEIEDARMDDLKFFEKNLKKLKVLKQLDSNSAYDGQLKELNVNPKKDFKLKKVK